MICQQKQNIMLQNRTLCYNTEHHRSRDDENFDIETPCEAKS
jgi:hypothetical protein